MLSRFGPVVIFKCAFCPWTQETPWVYSPFPPLNLEDYFAWLDMVEEYGEGAHVPCSCHKCQEVGLTLEDKGLNQKSTPIMEREEDSLDKILEGVK